MLHSKLQLQNIYKMNRKETNYASPAVKVVTVVAGQVLCGSGDIKSMTIDEDGGNDFE